MIDKLYYVIIILFISLQTLSQNLINNYSFEYNKRCPEGISCMSYVKSWEISQTSSDYFNSCSNNLRFKKQDMGVPNNMLGFQPARTGNSYAGLCISKEFIQTKLKEPLQKDKKYYIEFYVNLADRSYPVWEIGALFLHKPLKRNTLHKELIKLKSQINTVYLEDTANWVKVSDTYTAHGDEEYFVIRSFCLLNCPPDKKNIKKKYRYFFIDDVSVEQIKEYKAEELVKGKIIILNNVYFEFEKATLKKSSYKQLDNIIKTLSNNNEIKIEINGYTDNIGSYDYNLILSANRAKSVASYLIKNGIDKKRIKTNGYGSKNPVGNNNEISGREKNRRVEIKIL